MATNIDNPNVPPRPKPIKFKHPGNDETFLNLPANNVLQTGGILTSRTFGVHHGTALAACGILAIKPGFLSSSKNRDDTATRAPPDLDALLTAKTYYYHLSTIQNDPMYPILLDFCLWRFPHEHMPDQWKPVNPSDSQKSIEGDDWTEISASIQVRDRRCRVSGWRDSVSTAHIVPKDEIAWLHHNDMDSYVLSRTSTMHDDPRNLFALRSDLHSSQFDHNTWVIVPKDNGMVVYFIKPSDESAALYHNHPFDTTNLSIEFIYARFAWAIIGLSREVVSTERRICFRLVVSDKDPAVDKAAQWDGDEDMDGGEIGQKIENTARLNSLENTALEDSLDGDARIHAQDLAKAARSHRFFLEPDGRADPYRDENLTWYPGERIVESMTEEYTAAHPNIRSYSEGCPAMSDSDDDACDCVSGIFEDRSLVSGQKGQYQSIKDKI